jgi:signal transduction histidine kinase
MIIAFVTAVTIGFIAIGVIVRNIRKIVKVIRDFQGGNLKARIHLSSKSELQEFADSFNDMADTIVKNIHDLKRLDKNRRELAANISHDLRTPLTIIRGYAETIQLNDRKLTSHERKKYLNTILGNIDRMLNMVNELFELSKLEARDAHPDREVFSLPELLQDIHQKNQIKAQEKNIFLELDCEKNLPTVYADIQMMEKVFQNILDNAFNYTLPGGKIFISVKRGDGKNLLVGISDTGIGIESEQISRIFDRNYRIKSKLQNVDGTGLGLAIVKKIIDLHGFRISVHSVVEKGTTFQIEIPAHQVAQILT